MRPGTALLAAGAPLAVAALPFLLILGLAVGLVSWTVDEAPKPSPWLEAFYRQAQMETGVPWAATAALDGAANGFELPVESPTEILNRLVDEEVARMVAAWREWCNEHRDPLTGELPSPECDDPPDARDIPPTVMDWLMMNAYAEYTRLVREHFHTNALLLAGRIEWFATNPEQAYAGLLPADQVPLANDLYEGYLLLENTIEDDVDHADVPYVPEPPPGFVPAGGFAWPVEGPITSRFGPRWGRQHAGIDLGVAAGTPVSASKDGRVTYVGFDADGYGHYVIVSHAAGYATLYAHNTRILVDEGQPVHQGDVLALSGASGRSTGPHLHFEIRLHGVAYDPLLFLGRL